MCAWEPLGNPLVRSDPRCRIVLHMNWKAQTLPVLIWGLPCKTSARHEDADSNDCDALPQPPFEEVMPCSPLAQIRRGNYSTPTFLVHGTADDLIPWQQSRRTYECLVDRGVSAKLALVDGAPHVCDMSSDIESPGWKVVLRGYEFLAQTVFTQ